MLGTWSWNTVRGTVLSKELQIARERLTDHGTWKHRLTLELAPETSYAVDTTKSELHQCEIGADSVHCYGDFRTTC